MIDLNLIISIITDTSQDINGCLMNCSNNGLCALSKSTNLWSCSCSDNYYGSSCDVIANVCSLNLCKNGGSCVYNMNSSSYNELEFKCECTSYFRGKYCEEK